jgi:hypothetical protein
MECFEGDTKSQYEPSEELNPFRDLCYLESVHKLTFSKKVVIPAEAGIQSFQRSLDAPVSSTGQAPQVRHDGTTEFMDGH